jgi:hypothetical protein
MANKLNCPACAGPDNAECATCGGTSKVTQEVYDAFILEQERMIATYELQRALAKLPVENIPGEEQSIVVITLANNEISAVVDGVDMSWNSASGTWSES